MMTIGKRERGLTDEEGGNRASHGAGRTGGRDSSTARNSQCPMAWNRVSGWKRGGCGSVLMHRGQEVRARITPWFTEPFGRAPAISAPICSRLSPQTPRACREVGDEVEIDRGSRVDFGSRCARDGLGPRAGSTAFARLLRSSRSRGRRQPCRLGPIRQ